MNNVVSIFSPVGHLPSSLLGLSRYRNSLMATLGILSLAGPLAVSASPAPPNLIFPSSNTVNVSHSPPLKVRVTDSVGGNLTVRYYGRVAKAPGPNFTVVAMPDTQCYSGEISGGKKEMMIAQTEWAISNRVSNNVVYVTQLGDVSNNGDTPSYVFQWYNATNAMYRLENPTRTLLPDGMPYGVAVGNHEQTPNGAADTGTTTNYNKYFGIDRFLGRSYYAGHFGANNNNHVDFFSASGLDFMTIYFEYDATMNAPVLAWANSLLQNNPNRRAILVTHYFGSARTPSTFSTQGAAIYNALKTNANLFLMLSGHVCGEGYREDTFNGNTVRTLVSDYQCYTGGGNGFMRLMEFSPSNNVVVVQTYSPWTGQYETDDNSEFFFPYSMPPSMPSAEPFIELHASPNVPSGSVPNFSWTGLLPYRLYEWYVTVTDSANNTVRSPTWCFTTTPAMGARHDIAAGQLDVSQIPGFTGADQNTNCAVTQTFSVNDFRAGTFNRADYEVQVGPDGSQNSTTGVLISSVAQNGRNNYGTNLFATSAVQTTGVGGYRIVSYASANVTGATGSSYNYEYNMNVAGAWFPYSTWIGGVVGNNPGTNGGVWNSLAGTPGLRLGTEVVSAGTGQGVINLHSFGIDSRSNGVLLVNHARDEGNFALAQANTNDGTWNVFVKDNSAYSADEYEQDPLAFVFIPRTETAIVSGRFLADGKIDMFSGSAPMFSVTPLGTGRWELKITGRAPEEGTLIISAEGGLNYNKDNIVSYQVNANGDGYEIQSRDTPQNGLQTPGATEQVVSFVYVPSLRPGIAITPPGNLVTVESGAAATCNLILDTRPSADVTVSFASSDSSEGIVSPATITFDTNNWHVPRAITVTGVDDFTLDGDMNFYVTASVSSADTNYNGMYLAPISVVNVDNEPQLTIVSNQVPYGLGMPGIALDGQAVLLDPGTPSYGGALLTVAVIANADAGDILGIRSIGTGAGQISVSGNLVRYGTTTIGTFSGGTAGSPLAVSFNNAATPSAVQALLRVVIFSNLSNNPITIPRTICFTLQKADGVAVVGYTSVQLALLRVAQFQQGVDYGYGVYTSAADCELNQADPASPFNKGHSGNSAIWIDAPTPGTTNEACQALLRFLNISGAGLGQIPTNALIASAELLLTLSPNVGNSPGDGSPLFRMLVPWNPNSATWNNAGAGLGGFQPNNVHARSNYSSFLGLPTGEASTGTGTVRLGVTADVQAWVNGGETNCGWLMPGWQPPFAGAPRTDGTAFSGCEWTLDIKERPLLRVLWLPANTSVASFRQGVNGYSAMQDTQIRLATPDTTSSTASSLFTYWTTTDLSVVLLRFNNLIGLSGGQVPPGARVDAAILDLAGNVANAMGDGGQFFRLLKPWSDSTSTWNTWVNGIQTNGTEAATTPTADIGTANLSPDVQAAYLHFNLAADIQAWANGVTNNGWMIMPWHNGADAWGFASSEAADVLARPQLRVFYTVPSSADISMLPPSRTLNQVHVRFTSIIGTSATVQRSPSLEGPWTTLGTAVVGQDAIASFIDSSPLPDSAFYRVKYP